MLRKIKRLIYLFLGVFIISCSETEVSILDNINEESDLYYISLTLRAPETLISRTDNSIEYENGSEIENNINSVRFYFIDNQGNNLSVSRNPENEKELLGYYEYTFSNTEKTDQTKKLLLELELKRGYPAGVIAIVNPTQEIKQLNNPSLANLTDYTADFLTGLTNNNFVMSNSVFAKENGDQKEKIIATPLSKENFYKTSEEAESDPVQIYVERILSRIDISFAPDLNRTEDSENLIFKTDKKFKPGDSGIEKEIYIKFLGWAVTSTPTKSRLLKSVDTNWDLKNIFNTNFSWNAPDSHRSFWAKDPETYDYLWYSFNDLTGLGKNGERASGCFDINSVTSIYIQEHANPYNEDRFCSPEFPAKVICAAQLVDGEMNPITVVEYDSKQYTKEGLKNLIAKSLDMFTQKDPNESEGDFQNIFRKIDPSDLQFVTSMQYEDKSDSAPDIDETFYVYVKLTDEASKKSWYHRFNNLNDKDSYLITNPDNYINRMTFPAKIWEKGYTYYYFDIPHFKGDSEDDPVYYGVVRNHIYNATVKSIKGLGTPVYEPSETIYPETPPNGNKLEVYIKTLQWRMVNKHLQWSW